MPVDLGNHRAPLSAHHTCAEDGDTSNVCIGQVLAEIFGGIGGRRVVGLEFGGVVTCLPS